MPKRASGQTRGCSRLHLGLVSANWSPASQRLRIHRFLGSWLWFTEFCSQIPHEQTTVLFFPERVRNPALVHERQWERLKRWGRMRMLAHNQSLGASANDDHSNPLPGLLATKENFRTVPNNSIIFHRLLVSVAAGNHWAALPDSVKWLWGLGETVVLSDDASDVATRISYSLPDSTLHWFVSFRRLFEVLSCPCRPGSNFHRSWLSPLDSVSILFTPFRSLSCISWWPLSWLVELIRKTSDKDHEGRTRSRRWTKARTLSTGTPIHSLLSGGVAIRSV